jgi:hypothetical protein
MGVTADELGKMLYDSIQHKLMGLPDAVRVFPAHGAGSACGKNLSTELQSTIGDQRAFNYACQPMTMEQFLAVVTAGQPAGLVGQTGHADGPHLHLQLKDATAYPQDEPWFQSFADTAFTWSDSIQSNPAQSPVFAVVAGAPSDGGSAGVVLFTTSGG